MAGDVFILDMGLTLYQWNGKDSNKYERFKALELSTASPSLHTRPPPPPPSRPASTRSPLPRSPVLPPAPPSLACLRRLHRQSRRSKTTSAAAKRNSSFWRAIRRTTAFGRH